MATNHEVGSSNLSERTISIDPLRPSEHSSGAFLVSRDAGKDLTSSGKNTNKKEKTSTKVQHVGVWLSVKEAAQQMGVSPMTITRWCESGKLPAMAKPYGKTQTYLISPQALTMLAKEVEAKALKAEEKNKKSTKTAQTPHSAFVKGWDAAMQKGLMTGKPFSINTSQAYKKAVDKFLTKHIRLSTKTMQSALMAVPAHQFAKKARLYEALICFGKYLSRQEIIEMAFFDEAKLLKPKRHLPAKRTTIDEEELQTLLKACDSAFERLLVILPASTGLRASEACSLKWEDINFEKKCLTVKLGKGNKTRRVGLSTIAFDAIVDYQNSLEVEVQAQGSLFLNRLSKQMDRHGLRQRLERIGNSVNITVCPHALRRAFVTINANKGRPLQMLQMACGHADIQTTRAYCLTKEQEVIDAMKSWG